MEKSVCSKPEPLFFFCSGKEKHMLKNVYAGFHRAGVGFRVSLGVLSLR